MKKLLTTMFIAGLSLGAVCISNAAATKHGHQHHMKHHRHVSYTIITVQNPYGDQMRAKISKADLKNLKRNNVESVWIIATQPKEVSEYKRVLRQ